ncbi:MAG: hypothetical protein NTV01_16975 [Bacteroidia bacterium]|nr:hypothetical protein [Bacteroidia bacterium]
MGSEEPDRDLVTVNLKKGDNYFCVKISQGFGKWSFQFRFLDYTETVERVEKSAYLYTRPEIIETADEYQIFAGQRYKVELLPKKIPVKIDIADQDYRIISVAPPVIERIPSGRIPKNATIFFTADIIDSRAHRYSKTCPSEEPAYQEFDRITGLIINTLKPNKLHVNHDELGLVNSDSRCKKRNLKEHELLAYQVNRMRDIIKKYDPAVEMIMWADCINPFQNAGLKLLEDTGDLLSMTTVHTDFRKRQKYTGQGGRG